MAGPCGVIRLDGGMPGLCTEKYFSFIKFHGKKKKGVFLGISFLFHKSLHSLQSGVCRYSTSCTEVYNVKQGLQISALRTDIPQLVYVSRCKRRSLGTF